MLISELSSLTNTPLSTIRAYEKWNFISSAVRQENGYRTFDFYHVTQVKIVRLLFGGFLNKRLRALSLNVVRASVERNIPKCMAEARNYLAGVKLGQIKAEKALAIVREAVQQLTPYSRSGEDSDFRRCQIQKRYSAEEASEFIQISKGSIRNWERNGLINCEVKRYERRSYSEDDIQRMQLIDLLLQVGFSMSCIKRFFVLFDDGQIEEAVSSVKSAAPGDDFQTSADAWIAMLELHENHAKEILDMLEKENSL